ncbi:hypothetical protein [uncultured Nocardioides sp.]|uniref:hypothetical protein n=1 Tax=uncultured Nocardioides sp. TaxID=198441 RepID=UPI002607F8F3|nr:hypothetical protein [uncultured Nocardioides sp.]HRD59378.1 hypothetical protein [Nocardioides sp.]
MAEPDYFTVEELQTLPDCQEFGEPEILAAAAYFVGIVEREIGYALIPREFAETLRGDGSTTLVLSQPYARSLVSVTVAGASVDVSGLDVTGGVLRYASASSIGTAAWATGAAVVITYTAGAFDECPGDMKDSVMWATRDRLITQSEESGSWDRKTSQTNEFGTTSYVLPGEKRPTGYPELDALIASYSRTTASHGFA